MTRFEGIPDPEPEMDGGFSFRLTPDAVERIQASVDPASDPELVANLFEAIEANLADRTVRNGTIVKDYEGDLWMYLCHGWFLLPLLDQLIHLSEDVPVMDTPSLFAPPNEDGDSPGGGGAQVVWVPDGPPGRLTAQDANAFLITSEDDIQALLGSSNLADPQPHWVAHSEPSVLKDCDDDYWFLVEYQDGDGQIAVGWMCNDPDAAAGVEDHPYPLPLDIPEALNNELEFEAVPLPILPDVEVRRAREAFGMVGDAS